MRFLRILLISLLISSCCYDKSNERKPVTDQIIGTKVSVEGDDLGSFVGEKSGYLLFYTYDDMHKIMVFQDEGDSLKYVNGFVSIGRGPNEFTYVDYYMDSDSLYLSNSTPAGFEAIYAISLNKIGDISDQNKWKKYRFSDLPSVLKCDGFIKTDFGQYLTLAGRWNKKEIISKLDASSNSLIPVDYWIEDGNNSGVSAKQEIYCNGSLRIKGNKIVYACNNGRYLVICKLHDAELYPEKTIYDSCPDYSSTNDGRISYSEESYSGIRTRVTNKYIYAMLSMRRKDTHSNYKGYPAGSYDELEVYDWRGKFVKNYRTDVPFFDFIISSDDKVLYVLTRNPDSKDTEIIKYEL